jgi:hypothetical protein
MKTFLIAILLISYFNFYGQHKKKQTITITVKNAVNNYELDSVRLIAQYLYKKIDYNNQYEFNGRLKTPFPAKTPIKLIIVKNGFRSDTLRNRIRYSYNLVPDSSKKKDLKEALKEMKAKNIVDKY